MIGMLIIMFPVFVLCCCRPSQNKTKKSIILLEIEDGKKEYEAFLRKSELEKYKTRKQALIAEEFKAAA